MEIPTILTRGEGSCGDGIRCSGILNGLNPCSLSRTLLFLSVLAAGSGKFLRCGLSFLTGKYAAYVGLGLAVSKAAAVIPERAFGIADKIINVILLVFCLYIAMMCLPSLVIILLVAGGKRKKQRLSVYFRAGSCSIRAR